MYYGLHIPDVYVKLGGGYLVKQVAMLCWNFTDFTVWLSLRSDL